MNPNSAQGASFSPPPPPTSPTHSPLLPIILITVAVSTLVVGGIAVGTMVMRSRAQTEGSIVPTPVPTKQSASYQNPFGPTATPTVGFTNPFATENTTSNPFENVPTEGAAYTNPFDQL